MPAPPRRIDADLSASPCGTNVFSLPHHLNENGDRSWNEWRPSHYPEMHSVHVNCTVSSSQRKSREMIQIEQMVKKCLTFLENPVKVGLLLIDHEEANREAAHGDPVSASRVARATRLPTTPGRNLTAFSHSADAPPPPKILNMPKERLMYGRLVIQRIVAIHIATLLAFSILFINSPRADESRPDPTVPSDELSIAPAQATLIGRRATQQLVVSARAGGWVRDETRSVQWVSLNPQVATVTSKGQVIPKSNGSTTIVGRRGSLEASAAVKVDGMDKSLQVSFRHDVIPALSQAGCNTGACHGTPTGKGGLRLSLRGYLPDQDFLTLSREVSGRRINILGGREQFNAAQAPR